jgi:hypothetical protein
MDNNRGRSDSVSPKERGRRGKRIGLILNGIAILLAGRFLFYPPGANLFLPFDGLALLGIGACGLLIALPLSCVALLTKETKSNGVVGLFLSLTPVPLYVGIFALINRSKGFIFW